MMATFLFFRDEGFYPVEIPVKQLQDNITCNPGTRRVHHMTEDGRDVLAWDQTYGWLDKDLERQQVVKL